jgi:alkanesulfonate monooxygenase SsuD/methylene tetrahydromethanopterin reductase-like flavin-dependent oxidoreductase (luciferase family)
LIAVPPVETAQRFLADEGVPPESLPVGRRIVAGSPQRVRAELERLAANYGAEELLVVNMLHDHAARRHSYALIAEAFGLSDKG